MYKSLQAGRAIAAVFVVLFHLGGAIAAEKYFDLPFFSVPFSFGASGVEFFFVLSGFIILTAHRQDVFKPNKLWRYFQKRVVRIYPTYWIIFLVVFILALSSSTLRGTVPHDVFVVLKSLMLIPQDKTVIGGTGAPVLIVAWTLQYEVLFYAFFAIMILSRTISIILGLSWLIIYLMYLGDYSFAFPLNFLASHHIVLFFLGMGVSVICNNSKISTNIPLNYFFAGAFMFILVALDKILKLDFLANSSTLLYGIASATMIFGLVKSEESGRVIGGSRWLQVVGDSSYALYLIHYPLISILCKLSMFIHLEKFGVIGALVSYVVIFFAFIFVSVVFHLWIEKPVTKYFRNFMSGFKTSAQQGAPADARTSRR